MQARDLCLLHIEIISHGPTRSSSSRPGKIRKPKFMDSGFAQFKQSVADGGPASGEGIPCGGKPRENPSPG
jgi:hypothetical protein